jgi:ammonia channel protein AmtB
LRERRDLGIAAGSQIAGKVVQDILNDLNDTNGDHADDATWVLTSSFVILTMQSGFGMLEMGSSARGHEVNIMLKNVYDVVCGAFAYYALGFGISYGSPSNGFMGMGDFLLTQMAEIRRRQDCCSPLTFFNLVSRRLQPLL